MSSGCGRRPPPRGRAHERSHVAKLALIGLDCADPVLTQHLLPELPVLRELAGEEGVRRLRSVDPPITVPAWMCMMTGRDPGQLGVYGFRNRRDYGYDALEVATSNAFQGTPIWETLGAAHLPSLVIGVPGTYPVRPVHGTMVAGFPAPPRGAGLAFPASLATRLRDPQAPYLYDVEEFRTHDKASVLSQLRVMTERRFTLARQLAHEVPWELLTLVEMGPDRLHHAFWSALDPTASTGTTAWTEDALAYYRLLDRELGALVEALPSRTQVCIASDHGAQAMRGGIALNEWLIAQGFLHLRAHPRHPTPIRQLIAEGAVDWARTTAWGEGGYYGRVFLNVTGREPEGRVAPATFERVRTELIEGLQAIPDPEGRPLATRVHRPQDLYRKINGIPPDLLVYFDDLGHRSIGTVGHGVIHLEENDTGPDEANHAHAGLLIAPGMPEGTCSSLLDLHGYLLQHFELEAR